MVTNLSFATFPEMNIQVMWKHSVQDFTMVGHQHLQYVFLEQCRIDSYLYYYRDEMQSTQRNLFKPTIDKSQLEQSLANHKHQIEENTRAEEARFQVAMVTKRFSFCDLLVNFSSRFSSILCYCTNCLSLGESEREKFLNRYRKEY